MSQRYFVGATLAGAGGRVTLTGPEAHHLARVMRATTGEEFTLFDGRGGECRARIVLVSKQAVEFEILKRLEFDRETLAPLELAVALPKGDRQHWLVEKAVELGVTTLLPLITERGVAEPGDAARERMERWGVEACKQCGRNRLLEVAAPLTIEALARRTCAGVKLIAHPGGESAATFDAVSSGVTIAVGPEGGFTEGEVQTLLAADWRQVSLGPRILRVETAAVALAAFFGLRDLTA